ncbi:MAG: hypothetical protein R6U85_04180, partial [Salinivirgaceae bacterium]
MQYELAEYQQNSDFYEDFTLLATVKSFDLQAIRERYLKTRAKTSNRTGSVERRKVAMGGVVHLKVAKGRLQNTELLAKLPEPRGIHFSENTVALSSENKVFIIEGQQVLTITHPWFSYIHTVQLNAHEPGRVLVSSSGFDSIFEYDYRNNRKTFEWFAWENGFPYGRDPDSGEKVYITRQESQHTVYQKNNVPHVYIENPELEALPTAKRAAFINSVVYHKVPNLLMATFFHEGAVFSINRQTGKAVKQIDGLKNPHGGQPFGDKVLGTSTGAGAVVVGDASDQTIYSFAKLDGKPASLNGMEWIQNTIVVNGNFVSIDSNRNALVIFNPQKRLIDFISYDDNWAL